MGRLEEFRIALTAADYDRTLAFYRNVLGLTVLQEWPSQEGRGSLLSLGNATLEILDDAHAAWVDAMEAGGRVSGPVRLALKFSDLSRSLKSATEHGARVIREASLTPWNDFNARVEGPDGMQMTFFAPHKESGR
jgi:catechol 2,3-dioxygenase-like lactoylglutathione lyase family enzyme